MRLVRLPLRLLLLGFLLLVTLSGYLYWLGARTGILEQQVNAWLDSFLSAQLPLAITVADVGGEPWRELRLTGITVDEIAGDTLIPLLQADTLHIRFNWRDLLAKQWRVQRADLVGLRIRLRDGPDGQVHRPWQAAASTEQGRFAFPPVRIDTLSLRDIQLARVGADTTRLALARLQASIEIDPERIAATAQLADLTVRGALEVTLDSAHTELVGIEGTWFAEHLMLASPTTRANGSIRVRTGDSAEVFAALNLAPCRWNDLASLIQVDLPGSGNVSAEIQMANGVVSGRGTVEGELFDRQLDGLGVGFRYRGGILTFDTLFGRALGCPLTGRGQIDVSDAELRFGVTAAVSDFDLTKLVPEAVNSGLTGRFTAEGSGLGGRDLRVDIQVDDARGHIAALTLDRARGHLQVTNDTLYLRPGFEVDYLGLNARVGGPLAYSGALDIRGDVRTPQVTRLIDFLGFPGSRGAAQGHFALTGSTADPTLSFEALLDTLFYKGATATAVRTEAYLKQAFTTPTGPVTAHALDSDLWGLAADSVTVQVQFEPDVIRFVPARVFVGADSLQTRARFYPAARALTVDEVNATVLGRSIHLPWPAEFGVGTDTLWVHNVSLVQDSGSVTLNGWIDYNGPLDMELVTAHAQLGPWTALWLDADSLSGALFADIHVTGARAHPEVAFRVRLLDAIYQDFLFGDVVAGGLLEKTGARIDSLVLRTATAEYAVAGSVPLLWLDPGWRLDSAGTLQADMRMRGEGLRLATFLLPEVESLIGDAEGTAAIRGTPAAPTFSGEFKLDRGYLKLWKLRDPLDPVAFVVTFHDSLATVESASARAVGPGRSGEITAAGRLIFRGLSDIEYDLRIQGRDVPARYEFADFTGRFDFDLATVGVTPPRVSGTVSVREVYYRDPFERTDSLTLIATQVDADTTAWNLYLDVRIPKNAWTRNRDVNAEWNGDLRVLRQRGQWNYLGRLSPIRGSYYFLGKRFRNLRGEIVFDDIHEVDPRLNLEADVVLAFAQDTQLVAATGPLSRREVTVRVEGRLSEPKIVPPAWLGERNFILALNPLGNPEASSDFSLAESAALGAAGLLAGELERFGTRTLGVETFELRPSTTGRTGLQDTRLLIGTYLLPDVYVYGTSGFDLSRGTEIGFEYRLRNWLTLQGNRDFDNLYQFDLNLKWEMDK